MLTVTPPYPVCLLFRVSYLAAAYFDGFPLYYEALLSDVRKEAIHWQPWQLPQPVVAVGAVHAGPGSSPRIY